MSRAILVCWHKYTPFGGEFYEPMLEYFISQMKKFESEYDHIYFIDSTWGIDPERIKDLKASIIKVNPSLRYYDAYKEVLPQVKEDSVFLMDNDTVIWQKGIICRVFDLLEERPYEVVTVLDTIGEYQTDKLKGKNKFCPYWFATRKDLLVKYLDVDWGSNMPHSETLGRLTEAMLNDDVKVYEWPETKASLLLDGTETDTDQKGEVGYYSHIRAGSTPSYLMATREYGDIKTYQDYLKNQPKNEYLRQLAWFDYMDDKTGSTKVVSTLKLVTDAGVKLADWVEYTKKFRKYHKLP